jgi:hypothetical protein
MAGLPLRFEPTQQESCPVPDQTLGKLYASPKRDLPEILATLPELQRARLALFCHARAHLREMGLAIAATCEEGDLVEIAGRLGAVVFRQSRDPFEQVPEHNPRFRRRAITLATFVPQGRPPSLPEDDDCAPPELANDCEQSASEPVPIYELLS